MPPEQPDPLSRAAVIAPVASYPQQIANVSDLIVERYHHPVGRASDEAAADRELLRQFQAVEHWPDADKQVVKTLLHAFIAKRQIESIIR